MPRREQPLAPGLHQMTFFEVRRRLTEMAEARDPDTPARKLFWVVLALMGIGLVIQASHAATTVDGTAAWSALTTEHLGFRLAGILAMVAAYRVGPTGVRRWLPVLIVLVGVLLVCVYVPLLGGRQINGARRWVSLFGLVTFQPSELARIVLVLWVADRCVRLGDRLRDFRHGLLPVLGVIVTFFALVAAETDLGGSLLLFLCALGTLWVGGGRLSHISLWLLSFGGGAIAIGATAIPYIRGRVAMFLDHTVNDQVASSFEAIAMGGWSGLGQGQGVIRNEGTPYLSSDYVFTQLAEEFGLVGAGLVLLLLVAFLWFSLRLVLSIRDRYEALVAFGLLFSVALQAMIHVQVNSGLAPPKGMTLPFISAGGTSLVVSSLAVGLALGASRRASSEEASCNPSNAMAS